MNLVLMGIQGSGKSTQGNLISKKCGIPYLSSGHIFREMAKEKTNWGRYVKETLHAGLLIPDAKTKRIIEEYLSLPKYQKGWVLDGFPRTLYQAEHFKCSIDRVFYLRVSDKEALWRLSYRNGEIREDETLAAVRKRIELFHKVTGPVLDYYHQKGKLLEINGELSREEVFARIARHLDVLVRHEKEKS